MEYPQDKIVFFNDSHTYWLGAEKLSPISTWKKQWIPEFDREYWLTYKVLEAEIGIDFNNHYRSLGGLKPNPKKLFEPFTKKMDSNYLAMLIQRKAEEWERKGVESMFRGTRFHHEFEEKSFNDGFMINPWDKRQYPCTWYPKFYDNESLSMNLYDLPDGGYPELLIHSLDLGLAGQSDEVYIQTVGKKRFVDVNDHKTGEDPPKKSSPDYCYPPFDKIPASTHFEYTLQVNMYAYMLSLHGFIPRNIAYTYYKNYDLNQPKFENVDNIQKKLAKIVI